MGYHLAGFEVLGIDKVPQPRYPFAFVQANAVEFIAEHGHRFDFVHGSPPCQHDSDTQRLHGNKHPDLIAPTREARNTPRGPGPSRTSAAPCPNSTSP
jgi:DNA (cytosine-5)-methyltransferase 1